LKAVGISSLCDEYNVIKYASESETMKKTLDELVFPSLSQKEVAILDVGAGIGVWSHLFFEYFLERKIVPHIKAVDISRDALEEIKKKNPAIDVKQIDLKNIDIDIYANQYDCVVAVCCLHHIVDLQSYLNAIRFVAHSVKRGGYLLIEDPILRKPYSKFYNTDFVHYTGHSFPRPSYIIDDVLLTEGFQRIAINNSLSFLLSGNMESFTKVGFILQRKIWNLGYYLLYKSNTIVKAIGPLVRWIDRKLKKTKYANGTILIVYKKN
jgi:2-polyprenyl-3-methyl-5-hydroxy-6-metoxy-1,4-benzoquinol methylase